MANVFATKTGNWSDPTVWNTGALPTSADDVFSNNFTVTIDQNVTVLSIRNTAQSPAVAGGGYILNGGIILNASLTATGTLLTYTSNGTSTINGIINVSTPQGANTISFNSVSGVLNINGNMSRANNNAGGALSIINTGTVNVVGNINTSGSSFPITTISIGANCILNFTGDLTFNTENFQNGSGLISVNFRSTVNFVGTATMHPSNISNISCIRLNTTDCVLNITGTIQGGSQCVLSGSSRSRITIIGPIINTTTINGTTVNSTQSDSVNLFSGPFISSQYGFAPFICVRMHLIPSVTSYFELRDSSTNGAVSPGVIAPATRLVQPGYAVDAPIPANVRAGVVYASGTQTGTLAMPTAASVAFGVPVDNTTGTAVMSPSDVWNVATSAMTTSGSIGERLKNTATVDSTGDQLAALL